MDTLDNPYLPDPLGQSSRHAVRTHRSQQDQSVECIQRLFELSGQFGLIGFLIVEPRLRWRQSPRRHQLARVHIFSG